MRLAKRRMHMLAWCTLLTASMVFGEWYSTSENAFTEGEKGKEPIVKVYGLTAAGDTITGSDMQAAATIKIKVSIDGFQCKPLIVKGEAMKKISLKGFSANVATPGAPLIPSKNFLFKISSSAKPTFSFATSGSPIVIDGINVAFFTEDESTVKDAAAYALDAVVPGNVINGFQSYFKRDQRFCMCNLAPISYNASRSQLIVEKEIEVTINLGDAHAGNRTNVPRLLSAATAPGPLPVGKYMILTGEQLVDNDDLQKFMNWKQRKGYEITLVTTSDLDSGTALDSNDIIEYLQGLPMVDYPEYLLIVGDTSVVPGCFWQRVPGSSVGGYTDFNYSLRNDGDMMPDCYYGRLPASDNSELSLMIDKVLIADREPSAFNYYGKVLTPGGTQDNDNNDTADVWFTETQDAVSCYFENHSGSGLSCRRAMVNSGGLSIDGYFSQEPTKFLWNDGAPITSRVFNTFVTDAQGKSILIDSINNGACALFMYFGHGGSDNIGTPNFSNDDVDDLTNGDMLPLVITYSCYLGRYHVANNWAKAWLTSEEGGAYAVIASVDETGTYPNTVMRHATMIGMFDDYRSFIQTSVNPDWDNDLDAPDSTQTEGSAQKICELLDFAKTYEYNKSTNLEMHKAYQVFGDPESEIVFRAPQAQVVTHPSTINPGLQMVTVNTGFDGVRVCLFSEALGIHEVAITGSHTATFTINPLTTGTISVTVTGFGKRPYEGIISVISNTAGDVFGFEDASRWSFTSGSGTLTLDTLRNTQGDASMRIGGGNYREITSIAMNTTEIFNETSKMALDLYIGSQQPNPWWIGQAQLLISCPSANIYHQFAGSVELTGKPYNVFSGVQFNIPANVLNALQGNNNDFRIHLVLNTNYNSGPYLFDNIRFIP